MMPTGDLFAVAERFHRFGALDPAEQLYRQLVQKEPDHAAAWCRLGEVCHTLGQRDEAVLAYRKALQLQPDSAECHNLLGIALLEQEQFEEAAAEVREALRLQPDSPAAHNALGRVLLTQSQPAQAAAYFGRAVQLQPSFVEAWLNLGDSLRGMGRHEEAGASYERAAHLRPGDPGSLAKLGALLMDLGRLADAALCYERALRLRPDSAALCNNLGLALLLKGRHEEARLCCLQALYLQPNLAEAHNNLGLTLQNLGQSEEAILSFRQAVELRADFADAHNNLGLALTATGQHHEALACYQRAVQIAPNHAGALANLGNAHKDQGLVSEAIACYRQALTSQPNHAAVHSNLLLALQYQAGSDPLEILAEARFYAQRHAPRLVCDGARSVSEGKSALAYAAGSEGHRLRIGYVSADLRDHPVAYFLEPILANHDHQRLEIFCYANVARPDPLTQRFQAYADGWRSLLGLSDEQAAECIRQDGIDVLVDLNGHTGGNRLLVFARKPAPIQISYLGYLGTTGLAAMDYYLTDAHADPPGQTETHYVEQLIRLPDCGFCYQPGDAPDVSAELPARQFGRVTFASLNILAKQTEEVLALWARILAAVPSSRLLLRSGAGREGEQRVRSILARCGITPERVRLLGQTATRFDYLKLYQTVDLCLDPFPYNGVTTTCDALWMGVPVLTLAGCMNVSRQGVRFLHNVGLDELIADTPASYVRLATELGCNLDRLAALRAGLRERMSRSPLMNAPRFTRCLESAYFAVWEKRANCGSDRSTL